MNTHKVCLINLPTSREQDEIFFPMGPLVLASVLKQEEVPVEIVDLELAFRKQASLRWEHESATRYILQTLERTGANVFGISSICSNFPFVLALSNLIRKHFPE